MKTDAHETLNVKMARLEEKVENLKGNLENLLDKKLPDLERKIDLAIKYIYIGMGLLTAVQIVLSFVK